VIAGELWPAVRATPTSGLSLLPHSGPLMQHDGDKYRLIDQVSRGDQVIRKVWAISIVTFVFFIITFSILTPFSAGSGAAIDWALACGRLC